MKKYYVAVILLVVAIAVSLTPSPVLADGSVSGTGSTSAGKVPPNFSPSNPSGGGATSPTGAASSQQQATPNTGGGPQVKPRMPIQPIQAIKPRVPIKPRP